MVTLFVVILAVPMFSGQWLAAPHGDQYSSGYAFDAWETAEWRETGRIPLWNPMIMGGLPYIAVVTHGDTLYPTALLRIILPAHVVMNLSFILHYILAGFLTYLFLRRFAVSWTGAVTGARPLFVIYVPGATPESTGLPATPAQGGPWIMSAGTPRAHIMFVPTM